jgi:putative heme-binding domain-containing protein
VEVVTRDGQVHAGTLEQESGGTVKISKSATESVRLAPDEIAEMRPGSVSIMPQGLDQQLTPGELADLVAFLRTLK